VLAESGAVTVRASQAGDDSYDAATDVDQSFTVGAAAPTITFADGAYSFDNLQLFGDGRFYDFSHFFGPDLIGISGEVGGPAQFQFGIDQGGTVPEAATWALMLVGFGATGAAMRRRRAGVAFA